MYKCVQFFKFNFYLFWHQIKFVWRLESLTKLRTLQISQKRWKSTHPNLHVVSPSHLVHKYSFWPVESTVSSRLGGRIPGFICSVYLFHREITSNGAKPCHLFLNWYLLLTFFSSRHCTTRVRIRVEWFSTFSIYENLHISADQVYF